MYLAKEISSKDALIAWNQANEASLFCNPKYLSLLNHRVKYLGAFKNEKLLAVWPILIGKNDKYNVPPFSYYFGPFSLELYNSLPPYKAFKNHLELYNCLIKEALQIKKVLNFFLVPEFIDIRPFQWWNYNNLDKDHFKINLRYTAQYLLSKFNTQDEMLLTFRPDDKRKKLKKLLFLGDFYTIVDNEFDPIFLSSLYKETVSNSGGDISNNDLNYLVSILKIGQENILSDPKIIIVLLKSKKYNSVQGFQLLFVGKKRCYAIAQAVTDYARKASASIMLSSFSIELSKKIGCEIFDFNGANSPKRGDDKHAFGAYTVPYIELSI